MKCFKEKEQNCRVFTLKELKDATNGFKQKLWNGKGRYESVYRGTIRPQDKHGDPEMVAVKKLSKEYFKEHEEWVAEVQSLSKIDHPNLVKLLGYCSVERGRESQRFLVFEFMPNGTLEDQLFNFFLPHLPWKTRLQIMLGAAQALQYLHEGLGAQVIYVDFRPSKVLLDMNFHPKLSDFILARKHPVDDSNMLCRSRMVYGYIAPEIVMTGHLKVQSDVWTFGVVLYEILTGRRTLIEIAHKGKKYLQSGLKITLLTLEDSAS